MPTFTTRVELHDADEREEYDRLHDGNGARGISPEPSEGQTARTTSFRRPSTTCRPSPRWSKFGSELPRRARRTGKVFWILVTASAGLRRTGGDEHPRRATDRVSRYEHLVRFEHIRLRIKPSADSKTAVCIQRRKRAEEWARALHARSAQLPSKIVNPHQVQHVTNQKRRTSGQP
jgi:hypothetical protein